MKEKAVLLAAVAMLVLAMSGVVMASPPPWAPESPPPLVYVEHWLNGGICGIPLEPSEYFTVSVKAMGVEDLVLADFAMAFDPSVLRVVDDLATSDIEGINPDDQPNSFETTYIEMLWMEIKPDRSWCMIRVASGRPLGVREGLSGTVGLAKVTFHVVGWAEVCSVEGTLKLLPWDDPLIDITGARLEHNLADGMFANVFPTLWIKKKGAHGVGVWTEWHSAAYYDCLTNTLHAKIANTGSQGATARVIFKVMGPAGLIDEIPSAPVFVPAEDKTTVSVSYDLPAKGRYEVTGLIEYEVRPLRWVSWEKVESVFGGEGTSKDVGNTFKAK